MINENEHFSSHDSDLTAKKADLTAIRNDDVCYVWILEDDCKLLISKLLPEEIPAESKEIFNYISKVTRTLEEQKELLKDDGWTIVEDQ